ncbi:hypothetical protein D3C71_1164770 [compost metagenome]
MIGVSREHQPVKEPQPRGPRIGKQPVLLGRGPDRAQMVQQPPRRGRLAVDADDAPCSPRRLHPGAQTHLFALFIQRDHDGPGPPHGLARLAPPHLLRRRPAQALTGRQQTDRLQQIGLARPVRPMQHHGPAGNRQAGARIGTEVGEGEGGDQSIRSSRSCGSQWGRRLQIGETAKRAKSRPIGIKALTVTNTPIIQRIPQGFRRTLESPSHRLMHFGRIGVGVRLILEPPPYSRPM